MAAFLAGDYLLFRRLFLAIRSIEELQPFFALGLLRNLLGTVLLLATGTLFFSSITAAIGAFFSDLDLEIYHAAPIATRSITMRRWGKTFVQSTYLVTAFLLPLFVALLTTGTESKGTFVLSILALIALLSIPVSIASAAVILLIGYFPVRRIEQIAVSLGIMVFTVLVLGFRMTRPERLFASINTDDLRRALTAIELPSATRWPTGWLAGMLTGDAPLPVLVRLLACAILAFALFLIVSSGYFRAFVRARETSAPAAFGGGPGIAVVDWLVRRRSPSFRALIEKEVRTLVREAGQWSQLFMLAALVFLYLYNLKMLPLQGDVRATLVAYANLAMTGFVVAAMSVRFAYPAVSVEGKSFWIIESAPLRPRDLLVAKIAVYALPLTLLAIVLTAFANIVLNAAPGVWGWTIAGSILETATIVVVGIGMGGATPDFKAENSLEVGLSLGGLTFMALSLLYVGAITILLARPLHGFILHIILGLTPEAAESPWKAAAFALLLSAGLAAAAIAAALRRLAARS